MLAQIDGCYMTKYLDIVGMCVSNHSSLPAQGSIHVYIYIASWKYLKPLHFMKKTLLHRWYRPMCIILRFLLARGSINVFIYCFLEFLKDL